MRSSRQFLRILIIAILPLLSITAAGTELRQCSNQECLKFAVSDIWLFCPYCGTKLATVVADTTDALKGRDLFIGNMYKNADNGFQIEIPNDNWSFIQPGKALEDLHTDASIGLKSTDDAYCIVVVERMPAVDLQSYCQLITPELENKVLVSQRQLQLDDKEALSLIWVGELSDVSFHIYNTVVKHDELFFQIVSWMSGGNDNDELKAEIEAIVSSFRLIE